MSTEEKQPAQEGQKRVRSTYPLVPLSQEEAVEQIADLVQRLSAQTETARELLEAIEGMRPLVTNPHNILWNNVLYWVAKLRAAMEEMRKEVPTETDINRKTSTESGAATSPSGRRASEGEAQTTKGRLLAEARKLASELVADRQRGKHRESWYYQKIRDFALSQLRAAEKSGHLGHLFGCPATFAVLGNNPPCSCGFSERLGGL